MENICKEKTDVGSSQGNPIVAYPTEVNETFTIR